MKMQFLGSVALLALTAPFSFAASPAPAKEIGVNPALRDLAVKPGDNFEEYANGAWRKTTEIPADRSSTGVGFEVFQKAEKRNADLVREAGAGKPAAGTPQRMIADYYAAYMTRTASRSAGWLRSRSDLARSLRLNRRPTCPARSARSFAPTSTRSTPPISRPRTCSASSSRKA